MPSPTKDTTARSLCTEISSIRPCSLSKWNSSSRALRALTSSARRTHKVMLYSEEDCTISRIEMDSLARASITRRAIPTRPRSPPPCKVIEVTSWRCDMPLTTWVRSAPECTRVPGFDGSKVFLTSQGICLRASGTRALAEITLAPK